MDATGAVLTTDGFTALYDRHARVLMRFCARRVGLAAAEDVVANTFLIAYERRATFDPDRADPLPWLYGIATNVLRRHHRDEVRAYRAIARLGIDPFAEGPEQRAGERADALVRSRRVAGVLAQLPRRQRDVLLLVAYADLNYQEIAEALGIPVGSVRSALHRARTKLQAALANEGD